MGKREMALLFLAVMIAALAGCVTTSAGIAPSTTPLPPDRPYTVGQESVRGSAWGFILLGLPITGPQPTKTARDRALAKNNADALIDCAADTRVYQFILFAVMRTTVEGKAVKLASQ